MSWENFGGRKPLSFVKNNAASSRGASGASSGASSDVAKAFLPALAVAASLASETNVKTVSDGVETVWNVASLRSVAPVEEAIPGAVAALRGLAARLDASTRLSTDADFKDAWAQLEKATTASNDVLRSVALALAGREFDRAAERQASDAASRRLFALLGAAFSRLFTGELALGLAALEEIASSGRSFGDKGWALVLELRDMLARLSGRPTTSEFLRERVERYKTRMWAPTSSNSRDALREQVQAFELALATELLATDMPAALDALRRASRGGCESLNVEAAEIYKRVFGEEFDGWDANLEAGERKVLTIKGVDFAFRRCPPGTFLMGSPESEAERNEYNEMLHNVTLTNGFWMLETPVTQEMYEALTGENPSFCCSTGDGSNKVEGLDTSRFPVERVSWEDCQEFIKKLNALGVAPEGFAFRLPTEAEWEYACRAGTTTPYFWGSTLNGDKANCDGTDPYGT
ncbi:MAG: formylglycine-generating enzyme family protein, partial [Thermoguttaceae bacterium]|nr:formylglycine-generating enzyme family protein [Thermoguttaceae bacterium]